MAWMPSVESLVCRTFSGEGRSRVISSDLRATITTAATDIDRQLGWPSFRPQYLSTPHPSTGLALPQFSVGATGKGVKSNAARAS